VVASKATAGGAMGGGGERGSGRWRCTGKVASARWWGSRDSIGGAVGTWEVNKSGDGVTRVCHWAA